MALIMPYRIALSDDGDNANQWGPYDIIEMSMNGIFFIDIVLNFFTSYYDANENLVLDRKVLLNLLKKSLILMKILRKSQKIIFTLGFSLIVFRQFLCRTFS
jgi:hypothetical protein